MAPEAANYREDVEQARRRFAEFRQAHAVRSKSPRSPRRHPLGGSAAPAFVELLAETTGAQTSCLVEVASRRGGKLRLELKANRTGELAELIRAFAPT